MHFKKELAETVNIVVYRKFDNTIEIEKYRFFVTDFTYRVMNRFELEKVLKIFKPQGWNTGVFARNKLRSPTEQCVFICNTDCSHIEGTH